MLYCAGRPDAKPTRGPGPAGGHSNRFSRMSLNSAHIGLPACSWRAKIPSFMRGARLPISKVHRLEAVDELA